VYIANGSQCQEEIYTVYDIVGGMPVQDYESLGLWVSCLCWCGEDIDFSAGITLCCRSLSRRVASFLLGMQAPQRSAERKPYPYPIHTQLSGPRSAFSFPGSFHKDCILQGDHFLSPRRPHPPGGVFGHASPRIYSRDPKAACLCATVQLRIFSTTRRLLPCA
jgi:hypothetical protein